MLSKAMIKYVMSEDKKGYTKETQAVYDRRIRQYIKKTLKELTLIAQKLPEKLQDDVFNHSTLIPFFKELLRLRYDPKMTEKELETRRKRLLQLCRGFLSNLGSLKNAYDLAPNAMKHLKWSPRSRIPAINSLEAIYIESITSK